MGDLLMKPKIDFAFKELMAEERVRTGFLSAVLGIDPDSVRKTRLLNTYLRKEHQDDRQGILDVRVSLEDGTEIDIEIQLTALRVWAERSLFYLSKMFTEKLRPRESYRELKRCVGISILDFDLFRGEEDFYSSFHIREDSRGFLYTDKMEFHVIELPKLPGELREESDRVELWARFIGAERKEEFDMLAKKDPYIESAYEHLQVISQDREKQWEYEAREKAVRDYNEGMLEAEERGLARGEELVNMLNKRLLEEKRYEDLERAVNDRAYQRQLMQEYEILAAPPGEEAAEV